MSGPPDKKTSGKILWDGGTNTTEVFDAFCRLFRGRVICLDKIATGANDLIEIENCRLCEALRAVETIWYDRHKKINAMKSNPWKAKNRGNSKSKCAESGL